MCENGIRAVIPIKGVKTASAETLLEAPIVFVETVLFEALILLWDSIRFWSQQVVRSYIFDDYSIIV